MPKMTMELLLKIVEELQPSPGGLVSSVDIRRWCDKKRIDCGAPVNGIFWNCDLEEAGGRHRLLKFKTSPTKNGRNYFALRLNAPRAPGPASGHPGRAKARENGWVECVWKSPWDFKNAKVPAA